MDAVFDGGIGGGELAVICGGPSIGKSMFLINFAKRAMDAGRKVLYYTLELAEGLIGKRFDALITGININDLELRKDDVLRIVPEYVEKHKGSLIVKQYPTKKASVRDLQHHIDLLKRNSNWIPDMIFVDYADILKSNYRGEAKKRFELENIYEELRGIAVELNVPVVTASQSNKEGTYGEFVSLLNMSESFSKAAISDIVLGITRKLNGGIVNTGTCYIAKNRGFGRDGLVLPVTFQTNKATVTIPSTPELIEKVKTGELRDLAKYYFDTNISGGSMDDIYSKLK
jgi:predicted ATP-dependent serine protease